MSILLQTVPIRCTKFSRSRFQLKDIIHELLTSGGLAGIIMASLFLMFFCRTLFIL
jgi:hypothetical protein